MPQFSDILNLTHQILAGNCRLNKVSNCLSFWFACDLHLNKFYTLARFWMLSKNNILLYRFKKSFAILIQHLTLPRTLMFLSSCIHVLLFRFNLSFSVHLNIRHLDKILIRFDMVNSSSKPNILKRFKKNCG